MSAILAGGWFGSGGRQPWRHALRSAGSDELWLVRDGATSAPERLDADRWSRPATDADLTTLDGLTGPLLDIGCGPGRMVRAALDAGLPAWGIDVERASVSQCIAAGLPVLRRSVFDPLPREGGWRAVLLLDGNIGIGGDPAALMTRCRDLLSARGAAVVEVDPDENRDEVATCRVVGPGGASDRFAWVSVGERALITALPAGLHPDAVWTASGRRFVRLRAH